MAGRIRALNRHTTGWMAYFALARTPGVYDRLDRRIRPGLRACRWKPWKLPRCRLRALRHLGLSEWTANGRANTHKGDWRLAAGPLKRALPNANWRKRGLNSLAERFATLTASR